MERIVYQKTKGLTDMTLSYCPGCTHGIIHKLVAEVLEELGIIEKSIGVASVGCSVMSYYFFNCDMQQAAHGRGCAVATGIKRVRPDNIVFTYQGDGDLASMGLNETIHAASRGENITVIFVNNGIFGMTGGQMAPTTLIGAKTTTSQAGRDINEHGHPIRVCEILAQVDGAALIERVTVHNPQFLRKAKQALLKAFKYQMDKKGFTFIEFLSTCPVNWGMTPIKSMEYVKDAMMKYFPVQVFKDIGEKND